MKSSTNFSCVLPLVLAVGILAAACSDDGTASVGDGGVTDGGALAACTTTGDRGTLALTFTGLPAGVNGRAYVNSPIDGMGYSVIGNDSRMTGATMVTIAAMMVAAPDPLMRTAYRPTQMATQARVCGGETTTVTIAYAPIASSGKLWVGNRLKNAEMLGYAPSTLGATGSPAATVAADTSGAGGFTFDVEGNLWVIGATTADPPLARYPAATLGASGMKTADVKIESPSFGRGSPGPVGLAFNGSGDLFVTVGSADKVVKFEASQLTASGNPTAKVELQGIEGPGPIAFDRSGHLWVGSAGKKIVRLNASRLSTTGTGFDLEISGQTSPPTVVNLQGLQGLAFDKEGALWATFGSHLVKIPAADQSGSGMKMVMPPVHIEPEVTALPLGIAFDEGGGLWIASSMGKFGRFAPDQLTTSGKKPLSVVVTSADVGAAGFFAPYPAPANLPLAHSLEDNR